MALFGKKENAVSKPTAKGQAKDAGKKIPKPVKPPAKPDIYTLFLGLSVLFLVIAALVLGLNYYWYSSTDPAVVPMSTWAR